MYSKKLYRLSPPKKKQQQQQHDKRTFGINDFQNYESIYKICDFETTTNYLAFAENPIRFGSVVTKEYEFL